MIIINTKNYKTGEDLLKLARLIEKYDVHTVMAVPASDISTITSKTGLAVYAQHVDRTRDEKSTGWLSATSMKAAGATGALLNHSEHPIPLDALKETIAQCKKAGIITIVCVESLTQAKKIATYKPTAMAFEDSALISKGKSITTTKANTITKFVASLKGKPIVPICGAGISSVEDVKAAYKLGCKGVLIASAIAGNKNPERLLEDLALWQRKQNE